MITFLSKSDYFHLLTSRTPMALSRVLSNRLKESKINLSQEQLIVLIALWEKDQCSQQALANVIYRDKPSTTRLIDNLEKAGYIMRQPDEHDRRVNLVFLTDAGKKIKIKSLDIVNEVISDAVQGISEYELEIFKNCFNKIFHNLNHS